MVILAMFPCIFSGYHFRCFYVYFLGIARVFASTVHFIFLSPSAMSNCIYVQNQHKHFIVTDSYDHCKTAQRTVFTQYHLIKQMYHLIRQITINKLKSLTQMNLKVVNFNLKKKKNNS